MSEPIKIKTGKIVTYGLSSVPCRVRFSGVKKDISKNFHRIEKDGQIINYLRGRKLSGQRLDNQFKGLLLLKQFDDVTTLGEVKESIWYEREGHKIQINDRIKELVKLSELIHED